TSTVPATRNVTADSLRSTWATAASASTTAGAGAAAAASGAGAAPSLFQDAARIKVMCESSAAPAAGRAARADRYHGSRRGTADDNAGRAVDSVSATLDQSSPVACRTSPRYVTSRLPSSRRTSYSGSQVADGRT